MLRIRSAQIFRLSSSYYHQLWSLPCAQTRSLASEIVGGVRGLYSRVRLIPVQIPHTLSRSPIFTHWNLARGVAVSSVRYDFGVLFLFVHFLFGRAKRKWTPSISDKWFRLSWACSISSLAGCYFLCLSKVPLFGSRLRGGIPEDGKSNQRKDPEIETHVFILQPHLPKISAGEICSVGQILQLASI